MLQSLIHQLKRGLVITIIAAVGLGLLPTVPARAVLPPEQGPGGPILVIKDDTRPFSAYYAEILRAEGFNEFAVTNLSAVNATLLNQYDVVIVGEVALSQANVSDLTDWVTDGGNLIAMRPDKQLAGLLGLTDQSATLAEGYMQTDTSAAPGLGITAQSMQYHGTADKYTLAPSTTAVAMLYSDATTATSNPAVSIRSVGTAGGQAAAFTYDLARSVIYTHQGNPAWAGQERDGLSPIRPNDLFYGAKTGDVQPDYVNLDKVAVPQADEQQRLLGNMIESMNKDRKVLPKLWYFPKGAKAIMVMAGDDHATVSGTQDSFDRLNTASPANCDVANWECYRATSLMYANSPMTNTTASNYAAQGFDLGSHVSTGCGDWTPSSLAAAFTNDLQAFQSKYSSLPAQKASRTHCIAWSDWATQPKVELSNGIRMDLNYYYWPGTWVQKRPGFFTGNGIPMRFADTDGSMIDVYQLPSHLVNESGMVFPAAIDTVLDRALGAEGYYGAFGTHYDYNDAFDQQLVQSAKDRGVPIVSATQMLEWTDGRNNSSFDAIAWSGSNLNFSATVDSRTGSMLQGMLPLSSSQGTLQTISKSGAPIAYTTEMIKGISYALFPVANGSYSATYTADTIAPTVSSTQPASNATDIGQDTDVTATFSESMDAVTITNDTFMLKNAGGTTIPASVSYDASTKTAVLNPTAALPTGTYTASIRGGTTAPVVEDISGNNLATTYTWNFSVGTNCPCSLWSTTATPGHAAIFDTSAVELGVRFTSDQAGMITGIRFYKDSSNTGTHSVALWDSTGTALATAPLGSETATGWQTALFSSPVTIAAGTTYIASYFAPVGGYSYDSNYFTAARDSAPLHAPASSPAGGNGVYKYGGGFPNDTYNATNYWVDPIFAF